jgi:hypothetical protein
MTKPTTTKSTTTKVTPKPNPNYPAKTGNKSGGGRGNTPKPKGK